MEVNMLPASYGDCMLVKLKTNDSKIFTILIDGGTCSSYNKYIKGFLEEYIERGNEINLVIITHSDNDHIVGMNYILKNNKIASKIGRVIYNSPYAIGKMLNCWDWGGLIKTTSHKIVKKVKITDGNSINVNTSAKKANKLQQILFDSNKLEMELITNDGKSDLEIEGVNIKFLSPTIEELREFFEEYKSELTNNSRNKLNSNTSCCKSDYDIQFIKLIDNTEKKKLSSYNKSSLAFFIEEESTGQSILIMGDGSYELVSNKLQKLKDKKQCLYSSENPLKLNFVKLSHHGSICDLDEEFLKIIDCKKFLISTDGSIFGHPDKKTIARVYKVFNDAIFYFNYESRRNEVAKEGGTIDEICKYENVLRG